MPAMPNTSPARTVKLMSRKAPSAAVRLETSSRACCSGTETAGNIRSTLRPTICSTRVFTGTCAVSWVATRRPSRSTATRSAMRAISSSRWLI